MNYKNKIKKFIQHKLEEITEIKPNNTYNNAYKQALIDIECLIMDIDNENELIGKWGYFWDDENSGCMYGKLIKIKDKDEYNEIYVNDFNNVEFGYENFSLTIPKHCK